MAGLLLFDHLARRVPDLCFYAAAADGADHGAIFAHQQLGALVTGDGSAHLDDGRDGAFLAQFAQAQEFLVDIHSSAIIARSSCGAANLGRSHPLRGQGSNCPMSLSFCGKPCRINNFECFCFKAQGVRMGRNGPNRAMPCVAMSRDAARTSAYANTLSPTESMTCSEARKVSGIGQ